MSRPPDDPPPPSVDAAPDFDIAPPEAGPHLTFDAPSAAGSPPGLPAPAPWYQSKSTLAAVVVIVVAVAAVAISRMSAPETAGPVTPAPAAALGPLDVVPLADEAIGEQAPPPNVAVARPGFLPAGAEVIEITGRQAAGTVTRPEGAWLRATLEPGMYTFRVASGADTELHLSDVFNELTFNDDTEGLNPVITQRLIGGDYYLWLHIHDEAVDTTAAFTLTVDGPR